MIADLLGLIAIGVVASLTLLISVRWPSAGTILWVALVARVTVLLLGYYIIPLPDSGADAATFESRAWDWSQGGFFETLGHFTGPHSYFISWLLSLLYSVTDRSVLMAQSVSLLFGMATVWMGWLLTKTLWGERVAGMAGWVLALFPTLILYSALTMREAYIQFFVLLALYGVVGWARSGGIKPIILTATGFIGATFFHGAMIVGAFAFLLVVGISAVDRLGKALLRRRVHFSSVVLILSSVACVGLFVSGFLTVPKIGSFESAVDPNRLVEVAERSTRGSGGNEGASYPQWTVPNSPAELIYKGPVRALYFIFSPFPWDIRSVRHFIGFFDGLLYLSLVLLIFRNRRTIWADPASRAIIFVLAAYFLVFGLATGNFGTAIRHRAKFVAVLILLAAPKLKSLPFTEIYGRPRSLGEEGQ